jgi:sugar O-acyltransferase (sialic acid O-acetyltransferase NeuD family)
MMERVLVGAGGFAREVKAHLGDYLMKCFVDDSYWKENDDNIYPLSSFDPSIYEALVVIGDPNARKNIVERLPKSTKYFSFIHNSVQILGNDVFIEDGSIICAGCILTTNIKIGSHAHLNLHTTIGHDCEIGDYFTTAPGVKVSGNCKIQECVYIGTNASIKEKISINSFVTIGLNAGVVKNITEPGIYVGTPSKRI